MVSYKYMKEIFELIQNKSIIQHPSAPRSSYFVTISLYVSQIGVLTFTNTSPLGVTQLGYT